MKKYILALAIVSLVMGTIAFAKSPNGQPFQVIWDAIAGIQDQIDDIGEGLQGPPGEDGEDGQDGTDGEDGDDGEQGPSGSSGVNILGFVDDIAQFTIQTVDEYQVIPGTEICIEKQYDESLLRISYQETIRLSETCLARLSIDDVLSGQSRLELNSSGFDILPLNLSWVENDISAGTHCIGVAVNPKFGKIETGITYAEPSIEPMNNYLLIEELLQ